MPVLDAAPDSGRSASLDAPRARPVYRVFVSSTWLDLQPERRALMDALNRMEEMRFVGMEFFGNRPDDTHDASLEQVDRCDLFVGVIGHRYGSGITEAEYRRARARGLPCFVYFKREETERPELTDGDPERAEELQRLKRDLLASHTVKEFEIPEQLAANATADLHNWVAARWISLQRAAAPPAVEAPSSPDRVNLLRLLERIEQDWIKGVLEASLHHRAWLELGLDWRDDAVEHPWDRIVVAPDRPIQTLAANDSITAVFDAAQHTLLVLGEPGAGKTTTALELARDLIGRARSAVHAPAPVVLALSTWRRVHKDFTAWVVQELGLRYQVPKRLARGWLEEARLVLILDGLDEVPSDHRAECVAAINAFEQAHHPPGLAVTCRVVEYEALTTKLRLRAAICLQPLSPQQIERYFRAAGDRLAPLRHALREDGGLRELARSPLMLSVMTMAWQAAEGSPGAVALPRPSVSAVTPEDRRQQLFDAYVQAALRRRGKSSSGYSAEQTLAWLTWLAQRMKANGHTLFAIEQLQPGWLDGTWRQFGYFLATRLLGLFAVALPFLLFCPNATRVLIAVVGPAMAVYLATVDHGLARYEWPSARRAYVRLALVLTGFVGILIALTCLVEDSPSLGQTAIFLVIAGLVFCSAIDVRGLDIKPSATMHWSWRQALRRGIVGGALAQLFVVAVCISQLMDSLARGRTWGQLLGPWWLPALLASAAITLLAWRRWRPAPTARHVFLAFSAALLGGQIAILATSPLWKNEWGMAFFQVGVGVVAGVFSGFTSIMIDPERPAQRGLGFWLRAPLAVAGVVMLTLLVPGIIGIAYSRTGAPPKPITYEIGQALIGASVGALIAFLRFGGFNGLQHGLLRRQLTRSGVLPPEPDAFLHHAAQLALLQKVGLGYRFVHALLLDHLARSGTTSVAREASAASPENSGRARKKRERLVRGSAVALFWATWLGILIAGAALYGVWLGARGGDDDTTPFVGAAVGAVVALIPIVVISARRVLRLPLPWLLAPVVALAAGLFVLSLDDPDLKRSIVSPKPSPDDEQRFALFIRYSNQHPAGRAFRWPPLALPPDGRQSPRWREAVLQYRERIESYWDSQVRPVHAWVLELAASDRIVDLTSSHHAAEHLSYAARTAYEEFSTARAMLRAVDGRGDEAIEILLPLLQVGRKLQVGAASTNHFDTGLWWQTRALNGVRRVLETTHISPTAAAKVMAALAEKRDDGRDARRIYELRYRALVENTDSLGDAREFYRRSNEWIGPLRLLSPIAFNRRATLNRCAELFNELESLAERRQLPQTLDAIAAFRGREGTVRLKNAGGAWVVRRLCSELQRGSRSLSNHWSLVELRETVGRQLAESKRTP